MEPATLEFDSLVNAFCPGEGARDNSCSSGSGGSSPQIPDKIGGGKPVGDSEKVGGKHAVLMLGRDRNALVLLHDSADAAGHTHSKLRSSSDIVNIGRAKLPAGMTGASLREAIAKQYKDRGVKDIKITHNAGTGSNSRTPVDYHAVSSSQLSDNSTGGDGSNFEQLVANLSGAPRRRTLDGREYLVAPITIFPPGGGVMNGSKGPLFYSERVCFANPGAWNDVPLTGRHPMSANGTHVSAASDGVLESQGLGFLANDRVEGGRRRVDGWLDVENARAYDAKNGTTILADAEAGRFQEVSTGLHTDDFPAENGASHNGRSYSFTVTGWTPDHLAVLPDQRGACDIKMGCGVFNVDAEQAHRKTVWQKLGEALGITGNDKDERGHGSYPRGGGSKAEAAADASRKAHSASLQAGDLDAGKLSEKALRSGVGMHRSRDASQPQDHAKAAKRHDVAAKFHESSSKSKYDPHDFAAAMHREAAASHRGVTGNATENADLEGGHWVTTDDGNRLYIKDGEPVAGNPHVLKAAKGDDGSKSSLQRATGHGKEAHRATEKAFGTRSRSAHSEAGSAHAKASQSYHDEATQAHGRGDAEAYHKAIAKKEQHAAAARYHQDEEAKATRNATSVPVQATTGEHDAEHQCGCAGKPAGEMCDGCKAKAENAGRWGNPQSAATGLYKRHGSGTGKGEAHERAQGGAMMLTERDHELGRDAFKQLQETGSNPASWVADEATWERAKEAAGKSYGEDSEAYWPAVAHIYKNMGGEIGGKAENTDADFDAVVNAFCPGEGAKDNSCSSSGGGGAGPVKKEAGSLAQGPDGSIYKLQKESKYVATYTREQLLKGESTPTWEAELVRVVPGSKADSDLKAGYFKIGSKHNIDVDAMRSPTANAGRWGNPQSTATGPFKRRGSGMGKGPSYEAGNESGDSPDIFNEGDSPMQLNERQRATIVTELTANCACWRGGADTLNDLSDERLLALAKAHKEARALELTANALKEIGVLAGAPRELTANEMPAFIKKKIAEKEKEKAGDSADDAEPDEDEDGAMNDEETRNARRIAANAARPKKPQTAEQWLTDPSVPDEIRSAARFAMNAERGQKEQVVQRLVANVEDDKCRERLVGRYMRMSLADLQDEAAARPAAQPAVNADGESLGFYFGGVGQPPAAGRKDDPEFDAHVDLMEMPTLNFEEMAAKRKAAAG